MAKSRSGIWLAAALAMYGADALGMRLTSQPIFASLNHAVAMQTDKARCKATAGTIVEVIGESTVPGKPGTGYLLVKAVQGDCVGARASVRREDLTIVGPTP